MYINLVFRFKYETMTERQKCFNLMHFERIVIASYCSYCHQLQAFMRK